MKFWSVHLEVKRPLDVKNEKEVHSFLLYGFTYQDMTTKIMSAGFKMI